MHDNKFSPRMTLWRLDAVMEITGLKRSTLYNLVERELFPKPVKIPGTRLVAWLSTDIENWITEQVEQARATTEPDSLAVLSPRWREAGGGRVLVEPIDPEPEKPKDKDE